MARRKLSNRKVNYRAPKFSQTMQRGMTTTKLVSQIQVVNSSE